MCYGATVHAATRGSCLSTAILLAALVGCAAPNAHSAMAAATTSSQEADAGWLDANALQSLVREHSAAFQSCYDELAAREPRAGTRVSTRLTVSPAGRVVQITDAGGEIRDPGFLRCIHGHFGQIVFPAPPGEITLLYPLVFTEARAIADAGGDLTTRSTTMSNAH